MATPKHSRKRPIRYSATLQLQYLMRRLRLNQQRLQYELAHYYTEELWHLNKTKTGKIVSAKLRNGAVLPMFKRSSARPATPQPKTTPKVIIKKRRFLPPQ